MLKRFARGLAIGLTAVLAFASAATAAKKDNTIRFAYQQVLENVDPYFNNLRLGVIVGQLTWDTLIYRDPDTNEYKPQLATSWKWIDDRTLELELRQGVKFHNGDAFDADDVVYSLNFVADPANKVTTQQNVNWIEKAEKVDQFKVRIKTKGQFPAAIEYLTGPVVIHPHNYYAKVGPKGMNEKPVGSGPYKITENVIGKVIKLERNADYWAGSPKPKASIEKLEIRMIPDPQTQVAEMLAGGLDMIMNVAIEQAEQIKTVPHLAVKSGATMRIVFIQMNTTAETPQPALKDIRVRQAINHAIDRDTMAKQLIGEGVIPISTICFPSQFGCTSEGAKTYPYDVAKAKALLAEAGFKDGLDIDLYAYRDRNHTEAMVNYLRAGGHQGQPEVHAVRRDARPEPRQQGAAVAPDLGLVQPQRRVGLGVRVLQGHRRRHQQGPGSDRAAGEGRHHARPRQAQGSLQAGADDDRREGLRRAAVRAHHLLRRRQGPGVQGLPRRAAPVLGDEVEVGAIMSRRYLRSGRYGGSEVCLNSWDRH